MSSPENQSAHNASDTGRMARAGIGILAVVLLFDLISGSLLSGSLLNPVHDPSTEGLLPLLWLSLLGGLILIAAPAVFLMYMAYRRRLWALVLLIGVVALEVLGSLYGMTRQGISNSPSGHLGMAANAGNLIGIALLLSPQSLSWFRHGRTRTQHASYSDAASPWPVKVAILLYAVATAFDLLSQLSNGFSQQHRDPMYGVSRIFILLIAVPFLTVKIVALYNTYRRRNWARLLLAVLALASCYLSIVDIESMIPLLRGADPQWRLMTLARAAAPAFVAAASLVLLFVPSSNQWFRARSAPERLET